MAKAPATGRRKSAKKLQTPVGAEVQPEGAAASSELAEAKVAEAQIGTAAVDPVGAGSVSAAAPEQSRDAADAAAPDRKAATDEGIEPGATHRPPVAEPFIEEEMVSVSVASKSRKGRRRAGRAFGPEPVALQVTQTVLEQLRSDPQLTVTED